MSQASAKQHIPRYPIGVPNGWYAVARSPELAVGDVKTIAYFDEELVLFRGENGAAGLLEAYCDHLGAHLGHGEKFPAIACNARSITGNGAIAGYAQKFPMRRQFRPRPGSAIIR
jgi:hypothetical protein